MQSETTNLWFPFRASGGEPQLRLIGFPYAGGAAQLFRSWPQALPAGVEVCGVQLPGRWTRLREPMFSRIAPLVEAAAAALRPLLDRPFVLFGHSLGALIAFELARELRRGGDPAPLCLIVASRQAPQLPVDHPPIHQLTGDAFIQAMQQRYQGIPGEVLANKDLLEILLPAMRADMEVFETYAFAPEPPLACPITALGGQDDPLAPEANLQAWSEQTAAEFSVKMLPGSHFFFLPSPAALLQTLSEALSPHL